jgi:type II secretory pathway component PulF
MEALSRTFVEHGMTANTERRRGSFAGVLAVTLLMLFAHFLALLVLIQFMVRFVAVCTMLFDQSGVELPWSTRHVIETSHFLRAYWYLIFFLFLPADAALLLGPRLVSRRAAWMSTCWFALVLLGMILYLGLAHVALYLPLVVLVQSIS